MTTKGRIDTEAEREFCEAIQIPCDYCGEIICNRFCDEGLDDD